MADSTLDTAGLPSRARRIAGIDMLRGIALIAMVIYHFCWDLANQRLVGWGVASDPLWRGFAMAIAATFLVLAGLSLPLAHPERVNWRKAGIRLGKIAAGAALVSLVTFFQFPDSWIFFGILHMIALGSLVGLLLLRLPPILLLVLALGALLLPRFYFSDAFNGIPLAATGLADLAPPSNDLVPIFPWIAPLLAGMAIGRLVVAGAIPLTAGAPRSRIGRGLAAAGRWTLVLYLVHQPLLYGVAVGLAHVLPVDPAAERAQFIEDCRAECSSFGAAQGYCTAFCGCVAQTVDGTDIWKTRGPDASYGPMIATAASVCQAGGDEMDDGQPDDKPAASAQ